MCGRHSLGRRLDELHHVIGVGDHRHVVRGDFDGGGPHALGEQPLGIRRNRLIAIRDQEPGRQRFPGRHPHHVPEGGPGQRLLHRVHHLGLHWIHVSGEVVHEVVLWQPGEALLVDAQMRQGRGRRSLREQCTNRFALIQSKVLSHMTSFIQRPVDLEATGAIIPLQLGVPKMQLINTFGMINTGAQCTLIHAAAVRMLGMTPVNTTKITTVTLQSHEYPQFRIRLRFPQRAFVDVLAIGATWPQQDFLCIIGCDTLKYGLFMYNGFTNTFSLVF